MSATLKTAQEILAVKNKRGIREIPATVRAGIRMTKHQIRFSMIMAGLLIGLLIVVMLIAGNQATSAAEKDGGHHPQSHRLHIPFN